jgi:hypothetical protein
MSDSSDTVIERQKVREVAGVFRSYDDRDAAINALLLSGFDRADIDVIASIDAVQERLGGVYVAAEELADMTRAPRQAFVGHEDITIAIAVVGGILAFAAAAPAALAIITSGGGWLLAGATALAAAGFAGGLGAFLVWRRLRPERAKGLEALAAAQGLILWVRVHSPELEDKAHWILQAHGARAVRVHEIDLEKRVEDIPLSSLRPDPWLGSERLGHP